MVLIIGSAALEVAIGYQFRDSTDIDIIAHPDEIDDFVKAQGGYTSVWRYPKNKLVFIQGTRANPRKIIEVEVAVKGSNQEMLLALLKEENNNPYFGTSSIYYPSIDLLYMFKMSHRFLKNSPHFEKTYQDILFMRGQGAKFDPYFINWYKRREEETYDYGHPKLNKSKRDFFNGDGVKYVYDHDSIHEAVKLDEKPAYTHFKDPEKDVLCSKKLFDKCSKSVKLNAVIEESMVLALERSQIPFKGELSPEKSFKMALQKVCTSITSGWFREYAWENYRQAIDNYPHDYVDNFWKQVELGNVKEHIND